MTGSLWNRPVRTGPAEGSFFAVPEEELDFLLCRKYNNIENKKAYNKPAYHMTVSGTELFRNLFMAAETGWTQRKKAVRRSNRSGRECSRREEEPNMDSFHYLLMKANAAVTRKIMYEAGRMGLTPGQPKILEYLYHFGESDQKTIASFCEIEQATVGSILLRMEQAGLVVRRQHEGNRRSLFVSLTGRGKEAADRIMKVFEETDELAESVLSEEERYMVKEILKKTAGVLRKEEEKNIHEGTEK